METKKLILIGLIFTFFNLIFCLFIINTSIEVINKYQTALSVCEKEKPYFVSVVDNIQKDEIDNLVENMPSGIFIKNITG